MGGGGGGYTKPINFSSLVQTAYTGSILYLVNKSRFTHFTHFSYCPFICLLEQFYVGTKAALCCGRPENRIDFHFGARAEFNQLSKETR